jgi:hypothetical protein
MASVYWFLLLIIIISYSGCPDTIFALGIGLHVPDFVGSYQGYYTNVASSLEEDVFVIVRSRHESEAPPTTGPPA